MSAVVSLGSLCGWAAGLTWHAWRTSGWQDPGARLAWAGAIGGLAALSGAASLAVAATSGLLWLVVAVIAGGASASAGWWTCQHLDAPDAGERRDHQRGVRWDLRTLQRLSLTLRRRGVALVAYVPRHAKALVAAVSRRRGTAGEPDRTSDPSGTAGREQPRP